MLKPSGSQSIISVGILIRLYYIYEKKIEEIFTYAGVIAPKFGRKNIKIFNEISNKQEGLQKTYLSNRTRIPRGDKGTLFVLRKVDIPSLFMKFKGFLKAFKYLSQFLIQIDFKTK